MYQSVEPEKTNYICLLSPSYTSQLNLNASEPLNLVSKQGRLEAHANNLVFQWVKTQSTASVQGTEENLLTKHLPAPIFKTPLDVTEEFHLLIVHSTMSPRQYTNRSVAQNMEIMSVGPFIKTCFSFFLLFAKMSNELLLVIGSYRAVGHDQCCMKIPLW